MSFPTPHDGNATTKGTVLRFGANSYTVTNIVITNSDPNAAAEKIDVAHLGQTAGELAAQLDRPLTVPTDGNATGRQISFDFIGKNILIDSSTATVVITVAGTALVGSLSAVPATNYFATVSSSTLTLATNDAIRGQAVLTLARTDAMAS